MREKWSEKGKKYKTGHFVIKRTNADQCINVPYGIVAIDCFLYRCKFGLVILKFFLTRAGVDFGKPQTQRYNLFSVALT